MSGETSASFPKDCNTGVKIGWQFLNDTRWAKGRIQDGWSLIPAKRKHRPQGVTDDEDAIRECADPRRPSNKKKPKKPVGAESHRASSNSNKSKHSGFRSL